MSPQSRSAGTSTLEIFYDDSGLPSGAPVFLMHAWPYGAQPRVGHNLPSEAPQVVVDAVLTLLKATP